MSKTLSDAVADAHRGSRSTIQCPAHDDGSPSLTVGPGVEHPVVLQCWAGCETEDILAAEGLDWGQVCRQEDPTVTELDTWRGKASHRYSYVDEQGTELYQVLRVPMPGGKKQFLQRHMDANGTWVWNIQGVRRVIYRLHEVKRALDLGRSIVVTEGEKDAETARAHGYVATCNSGGAGPNKWAPEYSESLAGAYVSIVVDADDAGRKHGRAVAESLVDQECVVRILEPTLGNDLTDHYAHGGTFESLIQVWTTEVEESAKVGIGIQDFLATDWGEDEEVIPGHLARSNVVVLTGWEGLGKALDIGTQLPTPTGYITMGAAVPGTALLGSDGKPCTVKRISGHYLPERCWQVSFSDGTQMVADSDHQWLTWNKRERGQFSADVRAGREPGNYAKVRDTCEILASLDAYGSANHAVKVVQPIDLPEAQLPVQPYTFGVWLVTGISGDGAVRIFDSASGVRANIEQEGYEGEWRPASRKKGSCLLGLRNMRDALRVSGAWETKLVPEAYLRASLQQRWDLLAGICDSQGYVRARGNCDTEIVLSSPHLALVRGVGRLVASLGMIPKVYRSVSKVEGEEFVRWRLVFRTTTSPFRHAHEKQQAWKPISKVRHLFRYITAVEEVEPRMVQCVEVDSPDSTYLATDRMIVTHNTAFLRQMAVTAAAGVNMLENFADMEPLRVLYIDAENPEHQSVFDWRLMVNLAEKVMHKPVDNDNLILMNEWQNEPDLTSPEGMAWLHERIRAYEPDLCFMGPVQNLVSRDVKDDEVVRRLKKTVNTARALTGTAFIMEHHAPHRAAGDKERPVRPYGSSLFLKWPDYGYGLKPDLDREGVFELVANRKPRVRKRAWPTHFRMGRPNSTEWPWEPHLEESGARVVRGNFGT